MIQRVLECAGPDLVLVGGQALAFWASYFDVPQPAGLAPAISRDVDFFTADAANSAALAGFARAIGGRIRLQEMETVTALIGQAMATAPGEKIYNVDLLHQVIGLDRGEILKHAVDVSVPGSQATLRVLHPVHVLQSRNANLHVLEVKQDAIGQKQFALAIAVTRAYLEDRIDAIGKLHGLGERQRQRGALAAIRRVLEYAGEDAARKNAQRYGLHLADAIPAWCIASPEFWEKQWPHLRERMSPGYAAECERRRPPAPPGK
jgi:hypothetical protein